MHHKPRKRRRGVSYLSCNTTISQQFWFKRIPHALYFSQYKWLSVHGTIPLSYSILAFNGRTDHQIHYRAHPALLHWREKESLYLSPNLSFQAALASQMVTGRSKQHGKTNWDWDMRSLSLVSAVMLDVFGRRVKKVK